MKLWRYGQAIERLGDRYRLDGSLGGGAMADVCLAWDEVKDCQVAIKLIKTEDLDQELLNRFFQEAARIAGWEHPHILRIYDDVQLEPLDPVRGTFVPYIVMEYAKGGNLQKRLTFGQPHPLAETMVIFAQMCSAVQFAHEHGVIHGDIKPQNVLFRVLPDRSQQVVVGDFGLAIQLEMMHDTFSRMGTLAYLAPEQFDGRVRKASDIFALGVVLYQMCTGRLPYKRSIRELQNSDLVVTPPAPSVLHTRLPRALDAVIMQALSEDPARRVPSAARFWEAVHAAVKHMPDFATDVSEEVLDLPTARENAAYAPRSTQGYRLSEVVGGATMADLADDEADLDAEPNPIRLTSVTGQPRSVRPSKSGTRPPRPSSGEVETPVTPPGRAPRPSRPTRKLSDYADERSTRAGAGRSKPATRPLDRNMAAAMGAGAATGRVKPATRPLDRGMAAARGLRADQADAPTVRVKNPSTPPASQSRRPSSQKPSQKRRWRPPLLWLLLPLLLILVLGAIYYMTSGLRGSLQGLISETTQVALTPAKVAFSHTYTLQASPNPTGGQVGARFLSSSQSQTSTVNATGAGTVPGKSSRGTLTFFNGNLQAKTVGAGTVITGKSGVAVVTDANANIPGAGVGKEGSVTVAAHSVNAGANTDLPVGDISNPCCQANITVQSSAFRGGVDAQQFTFVQQSDINGAIVNLQGTLVPGAQNGVKGQLNNGEKLLGDTQCKTTQANASQNAGDHAPTVTVNVSVKCTNEAYNFGAAQTAANQQFIKDATNGFKLVGGVSNTLLSAKPDGKGQGGIKLKFKFSGNRVYEFTVQQQQALARLIAGKTKQQATGILLQQGGITSVGIVIPSGNGSILPRDPNRITITVQDVQ